MLIFDFVRDQFEELIKENNARMIENRMNPYSNGILLDVYREDMPKWNDVLSKLEDLMALEDFKKQYLQEKSVSVEDEYNHEKKKYEESVEHGMPDQIRLSNMNLYEEQIFYSFNDWLEHYKKMPGYLGGCTRDENGHFQGNFFSKLDYRVYFLDDLFDFYKRNRSPYIKMSGSLFEKVYQQTDSSQIDFCIKNYGLLENGGNMEVQLGDFPKIYDKKNKLFTLVSGLLPSNFVAKLVELQAEKGFQLFIRPDYDVCGKNLDNYKSFLLEDVVFGKKFEGKLTSILNQNEFVDSTSNDRFLVYCIGVNSVVFEEIIGKSSVDLEQKIVTQGVHIMFDEQTITHLDHEFFFYTQEEFENKKSNIKQYASVNDEDKYKTFKIDGAKIDYTSEPSENLLYQVLHTFFRNHELIDEYFQSKKTS